VSNVDSRPTNPAVQNVPHVAPTTAKKVKYRRRASLYYFLFLRMIESFINVRGLIQERRNFLVAAQKILKTNFTASRIRELYKRGVNTHHGSVCRICWKGKCITGLSSFCKLANTLITKGVVRNTDFIKHYPLWINVNISTVLFSFFDLLIIVYNTRN
jgi:hypothetical protein